METTIRADEISRVLKEQISQYGKKLEVSETGSVLAVGCISPDPAFSAMFTTFALSNIIGVQVVLGVTHALHSPLMAVTNAISGTTALGGMHLLAHSTSPGVTALAAAATTLSTVNIVGKLSYQINDEGERPDSNFCVF